MWVAFKNFIKKHFPFLRSVVRCIRNFIKYDVALFIRVLLHLPEKKPSKLIHFTIHLADHCNLNCVGCDHFSPLAEPYCISIEEFKKDFIRMGELFSHKCSRISLIGGEPLLNPDIIELMKIARENFTEGDIQIITNGILLLRVGEDFWRACHDNKIRINMTHYPIKLDVDAIKSLADKFDVEFTCVTTGKTMYKEPLDLSGKGDPRYNFIRCGRSNGCITLWKGKLFTCTMIPNVHFFNKAFNQNIPVTEADYVDIYSDIKPEEILRKMATHVPICSYCNIKGYQDGIEWRVSKREMSEWV